MNQAIQLLINGVSMGCIYGLVALGFMLIYNATGVVNFAQGEFVTSGAFVAIAAIMQLKLPQLPGLVLILVGVALIGWLFQRLAYQPIRNRPMLTVVICTALVGAFMRNVAQIIWGPYPLPLKSFLPDGLLVLGGIVLPFENISIILVTAALLLLLHTLFFKTSWGLQLRATAQDFDTARLMGIGVRRTIAYTWMLGAILGGAAGVLLAPQWSASIDMGDGIALKAFAACIIGGFGNLIGAVVGGLLVGLTEIFASTYISSAYKDAVTFLLMIAFLILLPRGIFGERISEKV
jgi:branched-chain amino acid transport system permease protein